jgi:localization factor PodJL
MPPFDEPVAAAFKESAIHRAFGHRHQEAFASPADDHEDIFREEHPLAAANALPRDDDFLSSARRSATASTAAMPDEPMATTLGGFTWGARREETEVREEQPRSRMVLIGGITLVAILAIAAGVMLSQRLGGTHKILQFAPATNTAPANVKPVETPKPAAQTEPKPNALVLPPAETKPAAKPVVSPQPEKTAAAGDRLTTLANGGNSKAQLLLGLKYLDGDGVAVNEAVAAKWLQRAAEQGEPIAQYRLGTLYQRGHGVATDAAKATHWYEAAARQGNRKAMHNLAVAYAEGSGTAKNYNEAARWFARAASLGLADSQFNLAVLYERGLGVPQSLTEAYKWYAIAATQGDNESKSRVQALTTQLSPADHDAAQKAADAFRPEALNRAANVPPETPGHG